MVRRIGANHSTPLVRVVGTRSNLKSISEVQTRPDTSAENNDVDELTKDVMKTGKPSEIRAALKVNRAAKTAPSVRADAKAKGNRGLDNETRFGTQTLKESKIRAASKVGPAIATSESPIRSSQKPRRPSEIRRASKAGRAAIKAELEKQKAERKKQERLLEEQQRAYMKMNKIRAEIDAIKQKEARGKLSTTTDSTCSKQVGDKICSSNGVTSSSEKDSNDDKKERKFDRRQLMKKPDLLQRTGGSFRERTLSKLSNLVPEMRKKASKRDLFFCSDELKHTDGRSSSPISKDEKAELTPFQRHLTKARKDRDVSMIKGPPLAQKEEKKYHKLDDQRKKLKEAKECFEEGYRLCWRFQDSHGALKQYRKALLIREGLLGKYHEETGRTYYWIGRSLCKLEEYDDAVVALSRAQRIFVRVLAPKHKYLVWTEVAIKDACKEINFPCIDYAIFKAALDESIAHEIKGDNFRKNNSPAQAITEYRAAIENIHQHRHPDSADLHVKIAIILRGMGKFEKALESNIYALEIYELSLGPEHPETVKTLKRTLEKKRLSQVSLALEENMNLGM
eukprot:jgi/Psemu1/288456/fgenesh1_pg.261_\